MEQYIDKDALIAEIDEKLQDLIVCKKDAVYAEERVILRAKIDMCKEILSLLDTLEVKDVELKLENENNSPKITAGTKIRLKTDPDVILSIISGDCHEDEFECSNGIVLSLKQIEEYYDIYNEDEHWQEVRESAAIAAMQGLLANPSRTGCFRDYAETAIEYTDALIEQLKNTKRKTV
jgi:hypothetical protein